MENLSEYRYCIAMKKGRKIFNIIAGCIMILISSIFIILTVIFYVLEQEFGFYTFLGILLEGADKILDYYRASKGAFLCIQKNKRILHYGYIIKQSL